jgi:antitoxin component of MazEF toxin-antitoxin module
MVQGIITKTGNSYAIRVPKRYIDDNKLKLGDVINVEEPLVMQRQALDALIEHGKIHGSIKEISDPVAWQRKQRDWNDRRENTEE